MATISETLALAVQHHRAGRLQAAEQAYRQILAVEPNHVDALHLLGVIACESNRPEVAVEYIGRAIRLDGNQAAFHSNLGRALKNQGKLDDAVACYRWALNLQPDNPEAHNNLGNVLREQRKLDEAIACYRRALEVKPDFAGVHYNLGSVLQEMGRLDEAAACYRRVLQIKPDSIGAEISLGEALRAQGKLEEAIGSFQRIIRLQPRCPEAYNGLGAALVMQGRLSEGVTSFRQALALQPHDAGTRLNLGLALAAMGQTTEAIACYQNAAKIRPEDAQVQKRLAALLDAQGRLQEAAACFRRACELEPDSAEAHRDVGFALEKLGKLDEAVACYQRALDLKPDYADAHNNLGLAFLAEGRHGEAVACFRRAITASPAFPKAHSNLLFALNFCPDYSAEAIGEEHRHWSRRYAEPLAKFIEPHANDRSPNRRLRVGYISPNFRDHPVGRFLLPLLETHDRGNIEVFCYASGDGSDAITDRFRACADAWRDASNFSDEQLTSAVRQDRIDILVDLTMHMAKNRLLVFARKPAPVQVTYLAYCGTTGLRTIDYRLTDPYLDPPGRDERVYSEQSIRLAETYWCYRPFEQTPAVNPLPALQTGHVTFGCLNNFCKVTDLTLAAWSCLLRATPGSQLVLHAHAGNHRQRVRDFLTKEGVSPERLTFVGFVPRAEYFRLYGRIDVALDPFPYGGGTTTCDGLWMGVPVVSLAGQTAVGRGGVSILSNLGLTDLVAQDSEQYVRIVVDLANNLPRLSDLRATMRGRMQDSPLTDVPRFTRNIEAAYRLMWQRWCAR
jgi:predicted O-linked N-acetylglucosamine transferase (SPINDLY family)